MASPVAQLGFTAVPKSLADSVTVPAGYTARVLYALGDPLTAATPAFRSDGSDSHFEQRAGDHHDGMEWFGLDAQGQPSDSAIARGLLAINHEATTDQKQSFFFLHADGGKWSYRQDSAFNRRVTTLSEAAIHGPARGSAHLVTKYSPDATRARGTLNNCGTGKTPWGTYVSGEENWFGYFHRDAKDDERRGKKHPSVTALNRYDRKAGAASRHGWESAGPQDKYVRWNNGQLAASARDDYRNEMNTFGCIVEFDPYQPASVLRKRTALWDPKDAMPADRLATGDKYLDRGTLYVARFKDDGTGEWIELSMKSPIVAATPDFPFKSDADVAIFSRLAADAVGATRMDRPEWGGVNPKNGEIYFTLTNNSNRAIDGEVSLDAANPRHYTDMKGSKQNKGNVNGHIIRLAQAQPADTRFKWDIYLVAAEAGADKERVNLSSLTDDNDLSSPDGLVFSRATGICWIQTDDGAYTDVTNCVMLAAISGEVGDGGSKTLSYQRGDGSVKRVDTRLGKPASSATLKRFLVGPRGCEITGWCETPDGKAMFVNIQHPGEKTPMAEVGNPDKYQSQWPTNAGYGAGKRPRSATIVITKNDGGMIGG